MNYKPIIIVAGEPNSIFLEILFKSIKKIKIKSPIILICSEKLFHLQMKILKNKINFNTINIDDINKKKIKKNTVNLINIDFKFEKPFGNISKKSNVYIENCFKLALKLINNGVSNKLINGPISKKYFLRNRFLGITEYLASKTKTKNYAMLIYNKNLSVSPITTHLPLREIAKKINKKDIVNRIKLINDFYKKKLKIIPRIGVTGLNPHGESFGSISEEDLIIKPIINKLAKLKYKIYGPFAADTIFMKQNRKKFDVIIGMYHDQVLTPIKTLYEYDAINITLGLPFTRISPDHGPNEKMMGKNKSNPYSLIKAIEFLDKN